MKEKVKNLRDKLVQAMAQWKNLECILVNADAEVDILDPYFALILDVFYKDEVPTPAERIAAYGKNIVALEMSVIKDRFFDGDIPVHLDFKSCARIESITAQTTENNSGTARSDTGTYGYYRLLYGTIAFNRTGWIQHIQKTLSTPCDDFWKRSRDTAQTKMEHHLSDMGASQMKDDNFFVALSLANFVKNACRTLFCINKHFEPSPKAFYEQVLKLPILPDAFEAQLETMLFFGDNWSPKRCYALAKTLAKSIVAL
jgi:hypothetical protein